MGVDNELREFLEAMEQRIKSSTEAAMESVRDELREEIRVGDRAIRSLVESVRDGLHEIIRRADIDAAFKDIDSLRRADRDLDKRVTILEGQGGR